MPKYIIGPELLWLVLYLVAHFMAKMNTPPKYSFDNLIEKSWLWVPALLFLTFGLFWVSRAEKNWLLLRIWIVGLVMGHFVLETLMKAFSKQGPGIGMGYIAGIIFIGIVLIAGSIIVKIAR